MLPAEHRDTATTLHELGVVKVNQGQYEEAEQYLQQADLAAGAARRASRYGLTLQVLGVVKCKQGRYEEAERYYQQALHIQQKYCLRPSLRQIITLESFAGVLCER